MRTKDTETKRYRDDVYVQGNAVRKTAPRREENVRHIRRVVIETDVEAKVKPRVGRGIDFFSMLILAAAIAATLFFCIEYLQIRADIVQLHKQISGLERTYEEVQKENEAFALSLEAEAPDLEYVYRTAVGFLGMVYPNKNDTRYYSAKEGDYFRQYGEIPGGN